MNCTLLFQNYSPRHLPTSAVMQPASSIHFTSFHLDTCSYRCQCYLSNRSMFVRFGFTVLCMAHVRLGDSCQAVKYVHQYLQEKDGSHHSRTQRSVNTVPALETNGFTVTRQVGDLVSQNGSTKILSRIFQCFTSKKKKKFFFEK